MALGIWLVPDAAAAARTVFVNLDPVVLNNASGQDPTQNSYNTTGFMPGPASGWPALTPAQQTELLYILKEGSIPFDIIYTFERPAAGSYDMVVLGTAADNAALFPDLGCSAAIGLADCTDGNLENISFLFWGCMNMADQADMRRVAFNIFAGLGFGWGLENLTGTGQIMAGYSPTSVHFGNSCTNISGSQVCAGGHVGCPAGQQNSTADLLARLGPRVDDGPPTVTITSPQNGMVVTPNIEVNAAVGDLFGGLQVELEVVEAGQSLADDEPPYRWNLVGIPQGTWTLRVTATDADLNMVSQEVQICVDLPACGEEPPGTTGGEDTGVDDTTGGDEFTTEVFDPGTSSSGAEPPPPATSSGAPPLVTSFGNDTPETGCQCDAGAGGGGDGLPAMLGMLLLLGALTRRE